MSIKVGIFRHECAFGNSAEHIIGLSKYLQNNPDNDITIYVEKQFQYYMAQCIPVKAKIEYFPNLSELAYDTPTWKGYDNPNLKDIKMPGDYPFLNTYPANWTDLTDLPEVTLRFPIEQYTDRFKFPKDCIMMQIREKSFWKRVDGWGEMESVRFVNPQIFFDVALYYANKGYQVIRVGDRNQTPMPKHKNIFDFALLKDRNFLDDLYLLNICKVFLSCDSGFWPMAGGMKRNLILSNTNKPHYTEWLPKETSKVLFKKDEKDNSFDELVEAVDSFLKG